MDIYSVDIVCVNVFFTAVFSRVHRICMFKVAVQDHHSANRFFHVAYSNLAYGVTRSACCAAGDIPYRAAYN